MNTELESLIELSQVDTKGNTHFFDKNGKLIGSFLPAFPSFFIRNYMPDSNNAPIDGIGPVVLIYEWPITLKKKGGINNFPSPGTAYGAIRDVLFKTRVVIVERPTREFFLTHSYSSLLETKNPQNLLAKLVLEFMVNQPNQKQ